MIAGNSASTGMIARYHAKVRLESKGSVEGKEYAPLIQTCEYWRNGDDYRLRALAGGNLIDAERGKGRVRLLILQEKGGQPDPADPTSTMTIAARDRRFVDTDPWELSLFVLPVGISSKPPMQLYDLAGAVAAGTVTEAAQADLDGRRTVHIAVNLAKERRSYEVWAAQDYNCALVKVIHRTFGERGDQEWLQEYKADGFIEASPSLYVPTRAYVQSTFKAVRYKASGAISDIIVNEKLPPIPRFVLPATVVMALDESNGTAFRVDRQGNRNSAVQKLGEWYEPPVPAKASSGSPRSAAGWASIAGAALFFVVGIITVWRRRVRRG